MAVIAINKTKINVRSIGQGNEIVLAVHSSASSSHQWCRLGDALGPDYRLVAPDVYGHGGSAPWHGDGAMSLEREVEILVRIVEKIPGKRIHLVGHSYGGAVALKAACQFPVRSLTLVEPSAFWMLSGDSADERRSLHEIKWVARQLDRAVYDGNYREGMAAFVDYWNGEGCWAGLDDERRDRMVPCAPTVALQFRSLFTEELDYTERRKITVPTLLVRSEHAKSPSLRVIQRLLNEIPESRTHMIHGAGHMAPFTHPGQVNAAIVDHVRSAGTTSSFAMSA